ncbi:MAG: helix-turn-helix transcriptional regulator [Candidatus Didemnitutus sp.]|nr:helix-turn-helix transcriptional regulator [Candidatus Didemnitutus sp.]
MKCSNVLRENIRSARLNCGLSQEAAAEKAGLASQHYQDIEAGRRTGLRLITIEKIADALQVEIWQLFKMGAIPEPVRQRGRSGPKISR